MSSQCPQGLYVQLDTNWDILNTYQNTSILQCGRTPLVVAIILSKKPKSKPNTGCPITKQDIPIKQQCNCQLMCSLTILLLESQTHNFIPKHCVLHIQRIYILELGLFIANRKCHIYLFLKSCVDKPM